MKFFCLKVIVLSTWLVSCFSAYLCSQDKPPSFTIEDDYLLDLQDDYGNVGPNFTVWLSFRNETPFAPATILLIRDGRVVASSETDSRGVANFWDIPVGRYEAYADQVPLRPSASFSVVADRPAGEEVFLGVVGGAIGVRSLRGRLGQDEEKKVVAPRTLPSEPFNRHTRMQAGIEKVSPLGDLSLELLDRHTGIPIMQTNTGMDGRYIFPASDPGVYVIRVHLPVKKGETISRYYDIGVELNPMATMETIPAMKFSGEGADIDAVPWADSAKALFDKASEEIRRQDFDVAHITLQTIVNTYPYSAYAAKASSLLQEQKIGSCKNVWSEPVCEDYRPISIQ